MTALVRFDCAAAGFGAESGALELDELVVHAGELVVVVGPGASGKTKLVNVCAGWERPTPGSIIWDGDIGDPPAWGPMTVVPQATLLAEELTVEENIVLSAILHRRPAQLPDATDQLGLHHLLRRQVDEISVGERQRVMVARALAGAPRLILADEPVAHQDAGFASVIMSVLRAHVEGGGGCLVATNDPCLAGAVDRVVTLDDGARDSC